jgi:Ulp1 family protease
MLSGEDISKFHIFGSFFYKALVNNNKAKIRKWTKDIDIFKFDFLLIPINVKYDQSFIIIKVYILIFSDHWKLAIICFSRNVVTEVECTLETSPVILILDSMGTKNASERNLIGMFVISVPIGCLYF